MVTEMKTNVHFSFAFVLLALSVHIALGLEVEFVDVPRFVWCRRLLEAVVGTHRIEVVLALFLLV